MRSSRPLPGCPIYDSEKEFGIWNSPLSSPFSTVSSRAWVFEVAGCSRRSPLRCAASSTAGARRRVPAAAAKTVHPAAVTCSRGSGLGWTAKSAGSGWPPRAPNTDASTVTGSSLRIVTRIVRPFHPRDPVDREICGRFIIYFGKRGSRIKTLRGLGKVEERSRVGNFVEEVDVFVRSRRVSELVWRIWVLASFCVIAWKWGCQSLDINRESRYTRYTRIITNCSQGFYRVGQVELETEISSSILVSSEMEEESI